MPVDYSRFSAIEDSDEEQAVETRRSDRVGGVSPKQLKDLEAAATSLSRRRCFCYLDFSTDPSALQCYAQDLIDSGGELPRSKNLGRVVIELDQAAWAPRLCENFRSLCTGERGIGVGGNRMHYKDCKLTHILPRFCVQVSIPNEYSCWGRYLEDEKLFISGVKFDRPGLVAISNHGPNTNTCSFMITLNEAEHLDGHNQIIGRVVRGIEVLRAIELFPTDRSEVSYIERNVKSWRGGKPLVDVVVEDSGELPEGRLDMSVPADGDDLPENPLDCSCTKDPEKLRPAAERIKDVGNAYFKKKAYKEALEKYKKAQSYLKPLLHMVHVEAFGDEEPATWLSGGVRPKDRTDVLRLDFIIKLNVCQVLIALEDWRAAIAIADGVLLELVGKHSKKGHGALPIDPLTVKALYRRARARVGISSLDGEISQLDEAIDDLRQALIVEPENQDVKRELERVRRLQRETDGKCRAVYQTMINS